MLHNYVSIFSPPLFDQNNLHFQRTAMFKIHMGLDIIAQYQQKS